MRIFKLGLFIILFQVISFAQISSTDAEFEAHPIGINDQLENILETQLVLPQILIVTGFDKKFYVYMNIDSLGKACCYNFETDINKALQAELKRMFKFLRFKRTLNLPEERSPYYSDFHISAKKYSKYKKQKQKSVVKSYLPADSSYIVYTQANKSPQYYKNGDEGFTNYILSELEYPKAALEKNLQGTVILDFVVETNGYVTNIEVKKGLGLGCSEEAVRLIKASRWQPAELNGKLVRYKITYPITFSILNSSKAGMNTSQ